MISGSSRRTKTSADATHRAESPRCYGQRIESETPWYDPPGHPGRHARLRWESPLDPENPFDPSWHDYAAGYRLAFERLIESVTATEEPDNTLAYPIVALGRHAIEVALKALIVAFKQEFGRSRNSSSTITFWLSDALPKTSYGGSVRTACSG